MDGDRRDTRHTENSAVLTCDEALKRADDARHEGLRGYYPHACIVLAEEVKRLRAALDREREKSYGDGYSQAGDGGSNTNTGETR
jgi:hypothetical protein